MFEAENADLVPDYKYELTKKKVPPFTRAEMEAILDTIYHLDVCVAVGRVAAARGFAYAAALPKEENVFRAEGLRHRAVGDGLTNDALVDRILREAA